ncbi:MAG: hypothetical protein J6Y78_11220 [Paludibacteraceae bacterium]|nr:hypothetical protein [Paludibacteraceae bacterium]
MKRMVMEEITDLNDLNDTDCLLIIFKKNNVNDLVFKFIKDDYYINVFDDVVYLFDRSLDVRGRFDIEFVEKFVRVRKE